MRTYEFYWEDKEEKEHLLGILTERRKDPERITEESVLIWGRMILGEWVRFNKIKFNVLELCLADFLSELERPFFQLSRISPGF